MAFIDSIREKAKQCKKHILLPEGLDGRTLRAAAYITNAKIAEVTLLGERAEIEKRAAFVGISLQGIGIIEPAAHPDYPAYTERYFEMRRTKGMTREAAASTMANPLYFAAMLVAEGRADGFVAGAASPTSEVLRPGLQIVKMAEGIHTVSSCVIMDMHDTKLGDNGILLFGDCAVNPNPTAEQLAEIALCTAHTARHLCGLEPRVAMLSFSTKGSAKHPLVDKVVEATRIIKERAPDLIVDGELQADAALVPEVGHRKSPGSPAAGNANVLIFPDLQSGNIGYKLVQRLAGAEAIGPICQGFARPVNDLSRGASVEDIISVVAMTSVQAQSLKE
ncbi:MAG: phosphate acetyltransferase [Clostridiales bacterium]|nr:phosphate acetyltransferase [Clostridiales bacterium]